MASFSNNFNFPMEPIPSVERRGKERFPLERELRYKVVSKRSGNEAGSGTTVNFSSGGVLFSTQQMLIPGKKIELAISWPAQLDSKCSLKLLARGRIVRCEAKEAAVEIQQYEFRTMGAHGLTL
jgi:c-di-GMP-binding flagellar brake protein YcgR